MRESLSVIVAPQETRRTITIDRRERRGTGKSTWLQQIQPTPHWIDLLIEPRFETYFVDRAVFSSEARRAAGRS